MKTKFPPLNAQVKEQIRNALSTWSRILDEPDFPDYAKDASKLRFTPEMVILAGSVEDIQAVIKIANTYAIPITPRGGGSGLAGGCLPDRGGIVLSTELLNQVELVDPVNGVLKVQAGTISQAVKTAAEEHGLYYPPDPAGMDLSTIGGNAATDAGGPACVKYGTTRDYILGLEAVLPTGEFISTGVQTRKGVVGYDLTNLLVGSEGTLGIITSLWLRLIPKPPAQSCMMIMFSNMSSAMRSVTAIMSSGHLPCTIEFLDHRCLSLVGDMLPFELPSGSPSMLLIELDGPESLIASEKQSILKLTKENGAIEIIDAENEKQRLEIWDVRRQVSLRIHDYSVVYIPEDVAVPISSIAELVDTLPEYEERYDVEIFAFGHAGDGNIHLSITSQDPENVLNAETATRELIRKSIDFNGTISGEHGIGIAKRDYLPMELSPVSLSLQKRIKQLFDPQNILNPGKVFP